MKKRLLTTSAAAVLLAGGAFFALQLANCGEQRATAKYAKVDILSSLWTDRDVHDMAYAMQWDDVSKKLLFDGMAIRHDTGRPVYDRFNGNGTIRGMNFRREMSFVPPPKHPDEYSFDAGTIGELGGPTKTKKEDGQIYYRMQWDESREWFVFEETNLWEPGRSFAGGYSSFNSNLDVLDWMSICHTGTMPHVP
jgi:hypothetical protein